jgi:hypothetical protein
MGMYAALSPLNGLVPSTRTQAWVGVPPAKLWAWVPPGNPPLLGEGFISPNYVVGAKLDQTRSGR